MQRNVRTIRRVAAGGAFALTLALVTGLGAAKSALTGGRGVNLKSKTITIGNIDAVAGPAAAIGIPLYDGQYAALQELNKTGGVDGFKLKFDTQDAQYSPTTAVTDFAGMDNSVALTINVGSPETSAIQSTAASKKMVVVPVSWDSAWDKVSDLAPIGTPYAYDIANGLDYLTKVNPATKGDTKVGIIFQNDSYGADGVRGFNAAVTADHLTDKAGTSVGGYPDTDGSTASAYTSQLAAMQSAGDQIVVLTSLPLSTVGIEGEAKAIGYNPTFLVQGPGWLEAIAGALSSPTYVMGIASPWGADVPGTGALTAAESKYPNGSKQDSTDGGAAADKSVYFEYGYEEVQLVRAILNKAIKRGNLSPAGILRARENLGLFSGSGIVPSVTYTPKLGPPSVKSIISKVNAGAPGELSKVVAGYEGPSAKTLKTL